MIEKLKLSDLKENRAPSIDEKIPIIKPDGGMEYSRIIDLVRATSRILEHHTIEPGKYVTIYVYAGIIWVSSSLGDVAFMGGFDFAGGLLITNDNYCSKNGMETPGKINVWSETAGAIYIENYTDAAIRFNVNGIGIRDPDNY